MSTKEIYLVEDDNSIRELVVYTMQSSGYKASGFEDSKAFWKGLAEKTPDLILLDIMLPDEDGIEILKKIRANSQYQDVPVIMLTAKGTEYDKVIGLDLGADDYIAKPFGMMELISRVKAVLRRVTKETKGTEYKIKNLVMQAEKYAVFVDEKQVALTLKEFELLKLLIENKGIVLSRDRILENIWGYDFDGETRTVDVHIRTLRSKLGSAGELVETVRGIGYKIGGA